MQLATEIEHKYRDILVDWFGNQYQKRLVYYEDRVWFVKSKPGDPSEKQRDFLAYLFGADWLNIAEVRLITPEIFEELKRTSVSVAMDASAKNTYLVRFVPDYSMDELPIHNLNLAIASELAFSLWIRRRDAHSFNRVYREGVPVFFDHQVGFGKELELLDLDQFFHRGIDSGWAGYWSLEKVSPEFSPDTILYRLREQQIFREQKNAQAVFHPINDVEEYRRGFRNTIRKILSFNESDCFERALYAGFQKEYAKEVTTFLRQSAQTLLEAAEKYQEVLFDSRAAHGPCPYDI